MPTVAVTDYTFPSLDIEVAILEPLGEHLVAWKETHRGRAAAHAPKGAFQGFGTGSARTSPLSPKPGPAAERLAAAGRGAVS